MDERTETRVLALGAIALGLFGGFAQYKWHDMPDWITNSALVLALFLVLSAVLLWLPSPALGVKKSMAVILIAGGICALITGLVLYTDASPAKDNDYLFYRVDIQNPSDLRAHLPIWFASRSASPFENVDCWWSPWGSTSPYPAITQIPIGLLGAS